MIEARRQRPTFFMHIAKTAGSYLNEAAKRALGEARVFVHAEGRLGSHTDLQELLRKKIRFVSGHLYYHHWRAISEKLQTKWFLVTIVRDPIDHLVSHILWLDHYNQKIYRSEYQTLPEPVRRLVDLIGSTDLADIGSLDRLMTYLPPYGIKYLDNCQSRYFLCGPTQAYHDDQPLTLADRFPLASVISTFDAIARQDRLDADLTIVNGATGLNLQPVKERINTGRANRSIDASNPLVRASLSKRVLLDTWLWRRMQQPSLNPASPP